MTSAWVVLLIASSFARGPIGEFVHVATGVEPIDNQLGYAESRMEKVATSYQDKGYQAIDQRVHGGLSTGEKWVVAPDVKIRQTLSEARLPTKDRELPSQLFDSRVKFQYRSRAGVAGVGMYSSLGQASDKMFKSINDASYNVTTYVGFGPEPRSAFLAFINFANDRPIFNNVPMPGVSIGVRLSPRWGISLGFPQTGLWAAPFDWLKLDVSVEALLYLDARLTVSAGDWFDVYFSAVSKQETFRRSGRSTYNEQIIYDDQTITAGLSKKSGPLLIELAGGLGMNRRYLETSDYLNDRKSGFLRIANGVVGQARIKIGF